jgi:alpha-L-arabinofuranosidase
MDLGRRRIGSFITESIVFGTHEFFDLCAMIGAVSTKP